jgi:ribosomal protein L7/L12
VARAVTHLHYNRPRQAKIVVGPVRELTGFRLNEAQALVESLPQPTKHNVSRVQVQEIIEPCVNNRNRSLLKRLKEGALQGV